MNNITYKRVSTIWVVFFLVLGFLQFWGSRFEITSDYLAYADISDAYLQGDWKYGLNSSWPPLFSFLLTIPIGLANTPESEAVYCHLLQYILFITYLGCIWLIIPELWMRATGGNLKKELPNWKSTCFISLSWLISVLGLLSFHPIVLLTQDMVQAPIIFFVLYVLVYIKNRQLTMLSVFLLSLVLALGFYAKSIFLFLFPFVCIAALLFEKISWRSKVQYASIMSLVFIALISPYVIAISIQQQRLTFGDSGTINYGYSVSKVFSEFPHESALTDENLFITPNEYPYHYAYWVDRVLPSPPSKNIYKASEHLNSLLDNLAPFLADLKLVPVLLLILTCIFCWRKESFQKDLSLVMPAVIIICMYISIYVYSRYTQPWIIWISLILLTRVFQKPEKRIFNFSVQKISVATLSTVLMLMLVKRVMFDLTIEPDYMLTEYDISRKVRATTAKNLCVIQQKGDYKHPGNNFWVRYTQCKIRAFYAPGALAFLNLMSDEKKNIYRKLLKEGIDTVVFIDPPKISNEWKHIGKNNYEYYLYPINREIL